jgi:hypothetical protein
MNLFKMMAIVSSRMDRGECEKSNLASLLILPKSIVSTGCSFSNQSTRCDVMRILPIELFFSFNLKQQARQKHMSMWNSVVKKNTKFFFQSNERETIVSTSTKLWSNEKSQFKRIELPTCNHLQLQKRPLQSQPE